MGLSAIAAQKPSYADDKESGLQPVFECNWSKEEDKNYDHWPDGWSRDKRYPRYVEAFIQDRADGAPPVLRIDLNSAGAILYSPPFPVKSRFSYALSVETATEGLKHDGARGQILFFAEDPTAATSADKIVGRDATPWLRGTKDWTSLTAANVEAPESARWAVAALSLEPLGPEKDVRGSALFRRVRVEQSSPVHIYTQGNKYLYPPNTNVTLGLEWIAATDQSQAVQWRLIDHDEKTLHEETQTTAATQEDNEYVLAYTWKAPLKEPGYYRVEAWSIASHNGQPARKLGDIKLAALADFDREESREGPFAWTVPSLAEQSNPDVVREAISQSGVRWLKYPIWPETERLNRLDDVAEFLEWSSRQEIRVVGVLGTPPEDLRKRLSNPDLPTAAEVFSENPENWRGRLEQLLIRLALRVQWWQLGDDGDVSFSGHEQLQEVIAKVRAALSRFGRRVNIAVGWSAQVETPRVGKSSWSALNLSADPDLTPQEISRLSTQDQASRPFASWLVLTPLSQETYAEDVRARDLFERMTAAAASGATLVNVSQPFDRSTGFFDLKGEPTRLFLPWRTSAMHLSGASPMGQFTFSGGSKGVFFRKQDRAIAAIWSDGPTEELLYLGEEPKAVDLYGREFQLPLAEDGQGRRLKYNGQPLFLYEVTSELVEFQRACQLRQTRLPSIPTFPHTQELVVRNTFRQRVYGTVELTAPQGWRIDPQRASFHLGPNEEQVIPLTVRLGPDVAIGDYELPMKIQLRCERNYKLTLSPKLTVGDSDLHIAATASFNKDGDLEVEQILSNDGDQPVAFNFQLYAPGRRRMRCSVRGLSKNIDRYVYTLPKGAELAGQELWLRGEEVLGDRVLNARIKAPGAPSK